jgi:hypothetical protein
MVDRKKDDSRALNSKLQPIRIPLDIPLASKEEKNHFFNQVSKVSLAFSLLHIVSFINTSSLRLQSNILRAIFPRGSQPLYH